MDIVYTGAHCRSNWLQGMYSVMPNGGINNRYFTFQLAFNLLRQSHREHPLILETGCQRMENDFGAGMSTSIWAGYIRHVGGGHLVLVDNDEDHLAAGRGFAEEIIQDVGTVSCHLSDSVEFLSSWDGRDIDLLYLDSYDYPYVEMMLDWKERKSLESDDEANRQLFSMTRDEVRAVYGDWIDPCQEHCLREFMAVEKALPDNAILLVDDNGFPGGGKPGTLKPYLRKQGWICLLDLQQTLWVRRL